MGLYNVIHGQNPDAEFILHALKLKPQDVGRFRDAFVTRGQIVIYTRNGGVNRACINRKKRDCGDLACQGCIITHRLPKHPYYFRDRDDSYDSTYACIYFRIPDVWYDQLEPLDIGKFDPAARWRKAIRRVKRGDLTPREINFADTPQGLLAMIKNTE